MVTLTTLKNTPNDPIIALELEEGAGGIILKAHVGGSSQNLLKIEVNDKGKASLVLYALSRTSPLSDLVAIDPDNCICMRKY